MRMRMRRGVVMVSLFFFAASCVFIEAAAKKVKVKEERIQQLDLEPGHFAGLEFMGGLILHAKDDHFGGWSGIVTKREGREVVAVSDKGYWLNMTLSYAEGGRAPMEVTGAWTYPLLDPEGNPLKKKAWADAESVVFGSRGDLLVSFERNHRIVRYDNVTAPATTDSALTLASEILSKHCNYNGGPEAIETYEDHLIMFCEDAIDGYDTSFQGWLVPLQPAPGAREKSELGYSRRLFMKITDGFRPTDFAMLDSGDLLILERMHDGHRTGFRLEVIPRKYLAATGEEALVVPARAAEAWQSPSNPVDNMECLSVDQLEGGKVRVNLMSDDNFSSKQQTVFFVFEVHAEDLVEYAYEMARVEDFPPSNPQVLSNGTREKTIQVVVGVSLFLGGLLTGAGVVMIVNYVRSKNSNKRKYESFVAMTRQDFNDFSLPSDDQM
uniref:Phytase-like domain-containing protein n=2 Tax=Chloropicon primus TaxID=1764295 RepID=A0A7S2WY10_9CHLO